MQQHTIALTGARIFTTTLQTVSMQSITGEHSALPDVRSTWVAATDDLIAFEGAFVNLEDLIFVEELIRRANGAGIILPYIHALVYFYDMSRVNPDLSTIAVGGDCMGTVEDVKGNHQWTMMMCIKVFMKII
jgi:hypothetical protein